VTMWERGRMAIIKSISNKEAHRARGRPKNVESSRVHLSLPETLLDRLHEIQRGTHASSLTEVVKNALQLYAAAVDMHKKDTCAFLNIPIKSLFDLPILWRRRIR
jgi:hypothetical protein